ncbi:MAG: (d)CMP kinase [Alphaproteobacteria bacterium]|nr:(d)CMP kinase [Alphaproteobacteria bacterium]
MIIALDGPAAAGKGTLAGRLAAHFGLAHLDTGALYRATARRLLRRGGDPHDAVAAAAAAQALTDSDLADPALRDDATAVAASIVSAHAGVRAALLDYQRSFAQRPPQGRSGAVIEGRDIGTVVCPEADHKIFVTATIEVRARRRHCELVERGQPARYDDVLADMQRRDAMDAGRSISPLQPAPGAYLLDTTELDIDSAFARAVAQIEDGRAG